MADYRHMSDAQILKKARRKVYLVNIGYYLLIVAGFLGGFYLLSLGLFSHSALLEQIYTISMVVQWFSMLGLFCLFMSEKPWSRTVYWVFFALECFTFLLPVWVFFQDASSLLACLLWMILISIKLFALYSLGRWLNTSTEAKIFFDRVLEQVVSSDELARRKAAQRRAQAAARQNIPRQSASRQAAPRQSAPRQNAQQQMTSSAGMQRKQPSYTGGTVPGQAAPSRTSQPSSHNTAKVRASLSRRPDYTGGDARPVMEQDKGSVMYPKLAIRLGAVVYLSLIGFPILVQIFQNLFVSTDNQQVFATRLVFTICIISAMLWTIPCFFLYLKEPFSKTAVIYCLLLEAVAAIWFGFQLYGYAHSETVQYGWHVFLYLIILDVCRLGLLGWGIAPVFSTPKPKKTQEDQDVLLEEQLPDDLIIAEDDEFFEEVPEKTEEETDENPDFLTQATGSLRSHLSDLSTRILLEDPGSPEQEEKNKPSSSSKPQNPDQSGSSR